jgi:ethanolamine ammonia-lyase small subunit
MAGEVLHTTGVVGAADRAVVAVLSVHPDGTPYARATADLTALVRSLTIPGATPAS